MLRVRLEIWPVDCRAGKKYRIRIDGCLGPPDESVFEAHYAKSEHAALQVAGEMLGDFIRRAGEPVVRAAARGMR